MKTTLTVTVETNLKEDFKENIREILHGIGDTLSLGVTAGGGTTTKYEYAFEVERGDNIV